MYFSLLSRVVSKPLSYRILGGRRSPKTCSLTARLRGRRIPARSLTARFAPLTRILEWSIIS
jgi:hypothetical protein